MKKYWHVVRTKNSIRVKPTTERQCKNVKGSIASYSNRAGAIADANTRPII
jgi:hypothetical protein